MAKLFRVNSEGRVVIKALEPFDFPRAILFGSLTLAGLVTVAAMVSGINFEHLFDIKD